MTRRLALIVFLAVLAGCDRPVQDAVPLDKEPVAVEAVEVTKGALQRDIEASGVVAGINEAFVVSETQGLIKSVSFELGDSVKKGSVLLRVDDQIAKLNMEQTAEQNETAQMNLKVTEKLHAKGSASKGELVRAQGAAKGAKAAYEAARKAYRDCTIRAPISGHIAAREPTVAVGNYLAAGARIARIVDIHKLKLEVGVGEREVSFVEEGADVGVRVPAACQKKTFEGSVKAVAAGSDPSTGSFTVVVTWDNTCDSRLKAGMSASARIATRQEDPVVLVPAAALVAQGANQSVMLAAKKKAARRLVKVGRTVGGRVEILEGLEGGETVILSRLGSLATGDPVEPTIVGTSGDWQ